MVYPPTVLFFIITGFLSAWLSFSIAYLMLKSWGMVRQDYLLGFPVGFGLLAFAYTALDINYVFPLSNSWNWARLFLGTYGFSFLAVTYFLRYGVKERESFGASKFALTTLGALTAFSFALVLLLPSELLPAFVESEIAFRIINLILLGYVIYSLSQALKAQTELSSVVLGFTFLVIEQFNLLIHALDRAFVWSVLFAELVRVVGLLILAVFLVRGFQRAVKPVK
jgi:hypothetical protein